MMDTNRIFEIMLLVVVLGAVAKNAASVDHAITSLAPSIYSFTNLLEGGSGAGGGLFA